MKEQEPLAETLNGRDFVISHASASGAASPEGQAFRFDSMPDDPIQLKL